MVAPTDRFSTLLDAVAAKQPTPGGGAVAAVCGALAAAIGEMAINYSIGRKATPQFDGELSAVLAEFTRARAMLLELMVEDQEAFAELTAAKKLDASDPTRTARVAGGVEACIAVPRAIGAIALSMLRLAESIASTTNRWLLSDLAVSVELSMATLRAFGHNVRANLGDVDAARRNALLNEIDQMQSRGVELVRATLALVARATSP